MTRVISEWVDKQDRKQLLRLQAASVTDQQPLKEKEKWTFETVWMD
jgi:hypothetical protein